MIESLRLARRCRTIVGREVRAIRLPGLTCPAAVHPRYPVLFYQDENLPSVNVWHECGHLRRHYDMDRIEMYAPDGRLILRDDFQIKDMGVFLDELRGSVERDENDMVQEERFAHVWAIQEACRKRYYGLALRLIRWMRDWGECGEVYRKARDLILDDLQYLYLDNLRPPVMLVAAKR